MASVAIPFSDARGVPWILVCEISMIGGVPPKEWKETAQRRLEIILESKRRDAALRRYTPSP
jgi:hypothetical protein